MNWYYAANGQQQGPVNDSIFRSLVANGTIPPSNLVWNETLSAWTPLDQVPGFGPASSDTPPPAPGTNLPNLSSGDVPGPTFAELRAWGRAVPSGTYLTMLVFFLIASLCSGVANFAGAIIPFVGTLAVTLLVSYPLSYGGANLVRQAGFHRPIALSDGFVGFHDYGRSVGSVLLVGLYIFLWSLLLVIPGIVKALAYSQTFFIMLDHPGMSVSDAITESRRLMDGNKWRLFGLYMSFIGWFLLGILTFGILFPWLIPYVWSTTGAFYHRLLHEDAHRV